MKRPSCRERSGEVVELRATRALYRLSLPGLLLILFGVQSLNMTQGILKLTGRFSPGLILAVSIAGWVTLAVAVACLPFSNRLRFGSLALFAFAAMALPTLTLVIFRWRTGIPLDVHDGMFQTELVTGNLLQGHDPYGTDFTRTELMRWFHYTPEGAAIPHHYIYYPMVVLIGVPIYLLERAAGLTVDLRPMLLVAAALAFAVILKLPFNWRARYILAVLLVLDPFFWWMEGRNDILWLMPVILAALLALEGRWPIASWALGLASALKFFAWPFAAMMAVALVFRWRRGLLTRNAMLVGVVGLLLPLALTVTPFLVWNAGAFWRDTVGWLLENPPGFPIYGFGLGEALLLTNVVSSPSAAFPFALVQAAIALPLGLFGLFRVAKDPTVGGVLGPAAVVLAVVVLCGRFTNDNYLAAAVFLLVLAITARKQEKASAPVQLRKAA